MAPKPRRCCSTTTAPHPAGRDRWPSGSRSDPAAASDSSRSAAGRTVLAWLGELPRWERFTLLKLLTGEFRVGVSQTLVVRALAQAAGLPHTGRGGAADGRLDADRRHGIAPLVAADVTDADRSRPYPFFLAAPLDPRCTSPPTSPPSSGDRHDWQIEWKWDGIRAQLIRRDGQVCIWSRGEELITARFPEIAAAAARCPTARSSTAKCSRSATAVRCPSSRCSSASAGSASGPRRAAPSRSCSWPTTCSSRTASTCATGR